MDTPLCFLVLKHKISNCKKRFQSERNKNKRRIFVLDFKVEKVAL